MAKSAKLQFAEKVEDLYELNLMGVKIVLFELETVQSDIGLVQAGVFDGDLAELRAKEEVIKKIINAIWEWHFGEDKGGCG